MKITGIVTEYNPFHNGHKYQIDKIKEDGSAVVCIMSGSFVQRGDVALFDKFTRAKCAVMNGADLVIELPCVYSLSTAQRFAQGAVSTLDALGVIDKLCFGSECGDIDALVKAADMIQNEPREVSEKIKSYISEGLPYPAARQHAFEGIIDTDILSSPNNILAIEYIRALKSIKSKIEPITLKRHIAGYHDTKPILNIASATSVRAMLSENKSVNEVVPENVREIYSAAKTSDRERLFPMLFYVVRSFGADGIKNIADVSEGLENKIYKECVHASSFNELAEAVKSKRYTLTRINRILMCILLGITDRMTALNPEYIRVLAMNRTGAQILAISKETRTLPVITKPSSFTEKSEIWERELFAADIAAASFGEYRFNSELLRSPLYIE